MKKILTIILTAMFIIAGILTLCSYSGCSEADRLNLLSLEVRGFLLPRVQPTK